jgi:hypothetical protein
MVQLKKRRIDMKQVAKIFIILGMVVGFWAIIPLLVGIPALKRLDESKTRADLGSYPVLVLLFVNIVAGIVMLVMKDEDLLV